MKTDLTKIKYFILSFFLWTFNGLPAQNYNPFYADIVSNVTYNNILNDLTTFEGKGIKQLGTTALTSTQNWIISRYQDLGYSDIELQPFIANGQSTNNIIVTKIGTTHPDTFLIIDAHYDTVNGPGTNDNGSGTVLLLELARLLKNVETEYSIKFIHFSGEEAGLLGSSYYVAHTVNPENMDIKLVFNIDQIGGRSGMVNDTIVCERDQSDPPSNNAASNTATTILANCMEFYSALNTEISYAYGSDYVPFENNGEIITGLYEKNESPYTHTSNDLLENMDPNYVFEVTKGALGAALEFAVGYQTLNIDDAVTGVPFATIYNNVQSGSIDITVESLSTTPADFKLIDMSGKILMQRKLSLLDNHIQTQLISSGHYLAVLRQDGKQMVKKIVVY